jgi:LacI family transcriptional regulator, galactose operon repressor
MGRVTISDVGAAAGVSTATVSRVLNGTARVDPDLSRRVAAAVLQLGYRPNAAAQGLARGQWNTIGVLVPDLSNPYFPDVLKAVSTVARSHRRRVMVMDSDEDPAVEHDLVEELMRCCDGILLVSPRMNRPRLVELADRRHPMVLLNRIVPGLATPAVSVDFFGGMMLITGHLAQLRHRRVAYLSGPAASWANAERLRALDTAQAFGITVSMVPCGATYGDGHRRARAALATGATAVVAYNDLVAQGALHRLRADGVDVPGEVSVIGFDDLSMDRFGPAGLTTVSVRRDELGRRAGEMLESAMTAEADTEPVLLPMHLVVRGSSTAASEILY